MVIMYMRYNSIRDTIICNVISSEHRKRACCFQNNSTRVGASGSGSSASSPTEIQSPPLLKLPNRNQLSKSPSNMAARQPRYLPSFPEIESPPTALTHKRPQLQSSRLNRYHPFARIDSQSRGSRRQLRPADERVLLHRRPMQSLQ